MIRLLTLAVMLAGLPTLSLAAPSWQNISAEAGRRIELDRSTLRRQGNTVEAQSRVTLDRELTDSRTGAPYKIIEATTRYDCGTRSAKTIKRIYKQNDKDIVREEAVESPELPVRSGTLDDRVLREVCRPAKDDQATLAKRANEAAGQLQIANESLLKKEAEKPPAIAATPETPTETKRAAIASIRPNFRQAVEKAPEPPPPTPVAETKPPLPAANTAATTPSRPRPIPPPVVAAQRPTANASLPARHSATARTPTTTPPPRVKSTSAKAEQSGGYMLEVVRPEATSEVRLPSHWSYEGLGGPENWAKLNPAYALCGKGERQSPIDIRDGIKVDLEAIRFNYRPSTFRIVDNGHTVSVAVGDSSFSLTGKTYDLEDIHFHRPAEMRVNGQRYDMSAHLVHRAHDGSLAVIALLMERGVEHPEIQTLWNNLPLEKDSPVQPPTAIIDPTKLLPETPGYFTFMGSLTTPPCTEGVLWIVMKQPIQVSDDQIRIFSRLYRNNARPTQATGDRLIKESR